MVNVASKLEEFQKHVVKEALKPVEPVVRPTHKYKVVLEQLSEETIEVEAEDELSAIELAINGQGEVVDEITFTPAIVASEELDDN